MKKRIANNIIELIGIWKKDVEFEIDEVDEEGNPLGWFPKKYDFNNIEINFGLKLPFSKEVVEAMEKALSFNLDILRFNDCIFKHKTTINPSSINIEFNDYCVFENTIRAWRYLANLTFKGCEIKEVNFEDAIFGSEENKNDKKGKVRFHNCEIQKVNFRNTTFNSLADFWNTTFINPVTFYKTDFRDIAVFSAATFKENVLFTYALIDKLMILRGAKPEKGFDLSLAIIAGKLSVFDFHLKSYGTYDSIYKEAKEIVKKRKKKDKDITFNQVYEELYESAVSDRNLIPIKNKKETYRILKSQLDSQKDYINVIPFKVKENRTHFIESCMSFYYGLNYRKSISDIIVLSLNAISNWFSSSYILGLVFTVSIAALFFNLALFYVGDFAFTTDYTKWQWSHFVQFLNPTHKYSFIKDLDPNPKTGFYILDFLGRIFTGYGIYQTIQAFRKYK